MSVLLGLWLLARGRCWLTPILWLSTAHSLQGIANHLQWHDQDHVLGKG